MPITLDGTNGITTPTYGGADTSEYLVPVTGFKNRIINGNMSIDQRNAGASVTPTDNQYTIDRWAARLTQTSKFTVQQDAGSVGAPSGFIDYLGVTSSSAYSVVASDFFNVRQYIEGFNTADLAWGTSNAKTVTLSFWVRSSLTGTFGGAFFNSSGTRTYAFSYTISSANTWEFKTVTVAGDTSGTWLTNNGIGIGISFSLGTGSTYTGTAGSWSTSLLLAPTGATSVVGTNGATFYITGVQLEVGSTATSFDYRPYGTELNLCQRYYEQTSGSFANPMLTGYIVNGTTYYAGAVFVVEKRAAPTLTLTNSSANGFPATSGSTGNVTVRSFYEGRVCNSTLNAGWFASNFTASAEL